MENLEIEGYWNLPNNETQVSGVLVGNKLEGYTLKLNGSLYNIFDVFQNNINDKITIHGYSNQGKLISLFGCLMTQTKASSPGYQRETYYVGSILIGRHYCNYDEIQVKNTYIEISSLTEWVGLTGLSTNHVRDKENKLVKVESSFSFPEDIIININSSTIKIGTSFNQSFNKNNKQSTVHSINLNSFRYLVVSTPKVTLDEVFYTILMPIKHFFSLAIGYPVNITTIKITDEETTNPADSFQYIYQINNPTQEKDISAIDMNFTYLDVKNNFEAILLSWTNRYRDILPFFELYFDTIYNNHLYTQNTFLFLVNAIEFYHRENSICFYISKTEFSNKIKIINADIEELFPPEYSNVFKNKLVYLNEFSLRDRITEICNKHENIIFLITNNIKPIVKKIVDARNYYTHYNKNLKNKTPNINELYYLSEFLKFLVEIIFYSEIFSEEQQIITIIKKSQKYSFLKTKIQEISS